MYDKADENRMEGRHPVGLKSQSKEETDFIWFLSDLTAPIRTFTCQLPFSVKAE
jgi:hypothetical protein